MKSFPALTAIAIVIASVSFVMAGPRERGGPKKPRWKIDDSVLSKLDLTQDQMEKVQLLRDSFRKEIAPLRSQVIEKKAELGLLWTQIRPDASRIRALEKGRHHLIGRIREKATEYRLDFRDLLTPEQTATLVTLVGERSRRHHKGKDGPRDYFKGQGKGSQP